MYHFTSQNFLNNNEPVEIMLVGAGGTGSSLLTGLGQINHALLELGHRTGLRVIVVDPDVVSPSNIGRQMFSKFDIGESKARILVERINRFYGIHWLSSPYFFNEDTIGQHYMPDMIISCTDTVSSRRLIKNVLEDEIRSWDDISGIYWLDTGNNANSGQVILSTIGLIEQGKTGGINWLPDIFYFFPDLTDDQFANQPSCSMNDALQKQDLFINRTISNYALDIIWRMFRYAKIEHHGCFVSLDDYTTRPISVKNSYESFYQLKDVA